MRVLTHADLSVPKRLASAVKKVIAQVEADDLRSCDMKKLGQRGRFYRAKLDYDARLLFTFGVHEGATIAFALEVIEKHAYERSRFLRGAVVDEAKLAGEGGSTDIEPEPLVYVHPQRARFHYLEKPLTFDDTQDALYRQAPPLVLVGAAGSGKTAVLLEKLRALSGAGPVAYVTQSAWLAESARGLFGPAADEDASSCEFLSFRAFLESVRVPEGRAVTGRDFRAFFERHASKLKGTDAHACFEEIRGVLAAEPEGPLSLDAYLALGPRQSLYSPELRKQVHALFGHYVAWLHEAKLFDTNLLAHRYSALVQPTYEAIVVDEVQDFTNAELSLLLACCKNRGAFVLSGDAHQIVHPNLFSWSKLKSLFFRDDALAKDDVAFLTTSYRNARAVTAVANRLLKIKWTRFGSIDRESNALTRSAGGREGSVTGLSPTPAALAELSQKVRRSTRAAVVVLRDEHKAEASRVYGTPLVFSVHEAKGLEYETVILHGLVGAEGAAYRALSDGVSAADLERDELDYRRAKDKNDKSLEAYKFYANALYVALTRAVENVVVVEREAHHPLLRLLDIPFSESTSRIDKVTSSVEDWQREARALELRGKAEQAASILSTVLKTERVPWTVIEGEAYRELCKKAFEQGSIFKKAKEQLLDYAAAHGIQPLAKRLELVGLADASTFAQRMPQMEARMVEVYRRKNPSDALYACEKYGIEHKNPAGLTPLMLAALAGNARLVRALLERGASRTARDAFGRTAMHYVLFPLMAKGEEDPVMIELADAYAALALDAVDLRVDGRLVRLYPHQAEFVHLAVLTTHYASMFRWLGQIELVSRAFFVNPKVPSALGLLDCLPGSIVPAYRLAPTYVNAALAKNERDATAKPSRKLWRRIRHGEYLPNPEIAVRYGAGEVSGEFVPIEELLGKPILLEHMSAEGRASVR